MPANKTEFFVDADGNYLGSHCGDDKLRPEQFGRPTSRKVPAAPPAMLDQWDGSKWKAPV